ncbi:MAG: hypothetical protein TEF_06265 [Rhizobiales bacterium NRL2]|jgi:flagellar hook-associated protein 3 FlgL|nr:MAG: hypothetical protein TEF_06265 [Rhizobiales bacterium NRL2]
MRIGTFSQNDLLVQQMLRQQVELSRSQEQVSTGKRYNDTEGFGAQSANIVNSRSLLTQIEGFQTSNQALKGRLSAFDSALVELESIGGDLRDALQKARGLGDGTGLGTTVSGLLERAAAVLNTRFEGRFLFGGTTSDQPPLLVTDEAEILAVAEPPGGQFFADSGEALTARVDERTTIEIGVTASQVAGDLLHSMQRILMFDSGTLPAGAAGFAPADALAGQLSENEIDFIADELDNVFSAVTGLQTAATENGLNMKALDDVQGRLEDQQIALTDILANEEDVDLAKVAAKLNQQQVALEASLRMIAQMRSMSLLNFL